MGIHHSGTRHRKLGPFRAAGYQVSAFALEAGLRRTVSQLLAAELTVRTESREVDSLVPSGEDRRLGSLELLPLNLLLQLRPFRQGLVRPYASAGVNLTVAWEKSGTLDPVVLIHQSPAAGVTSVKRE
jgi:outer membrane protein W